MVGRHAEGNPRLPQPPLGPDEPLGQGCLRDQERARDLGCLEATHLAEREGDAGLDCERRVAAREEQREALVGDRAHVVVLRHGDRLEAGKQLRLARERALAADPVDRAVSRCGDDPRPG